MSALRQALEEELRRFSAEDAHGEVCVLGDGKPLREAAEAGEVSLSPRDQGAARTVVQFLLDGMKDERGVHAESLVAMMGGIVGRAALREYEPEWRGVDAKFTVLLIEDVNRDLLRISEFIESIYGGNSPEPIVVAEELPEIHAPNAGVLRFIEKGHAKVDAGLSQVEVEPGQKRWVLAYALIQVLAMTREALPPPAAFRLALRYMVRAAKTPAAHLPALKP